jgi:hypothetical protein
MAVTLAWALWRGMDADYKRKYARVVWDQFQTRLQGEAMTTADLGQYVSSVSSKLGVAHLGEGGDLEEIDAILRAGQDRPVLRALRDRTALVVVRVRLLNEARKEEYEERRRQHPNAYEQEDELIEAQQGGLLNDDEN